MAIYMSQLQETLCKGCTCFKQINGDKAYCPFAKCLWNEILRWYDGNIINIRYKNRITGEIRTIAVYSPKGGADLDG